MDGSVTLDFLSALTSGRASFVDYLGRCDMAVRSFPDDHPDKPGAVEFQSGGERWLAEFYPNGNFKALVWG